ncbi:MAG: tetratricopeptide repeat protein [Phycisphaerae bacterium]|nr:tetratricopeptide repeat protein [Phycisphaerae bacterium]NIS50232.1 tetratricopeptide repeat protein [Phycisphaerae bacterium]NIU07896.1 tetratricopeptide repeat protein [Phycisphaerae bacterium]NIU55498.1 tetratricopeptide repeat protein [Phycisphaerae bacterium]NIU99867.1 tetratricopeptide repeat protein [Phycisphaerae bacterium]
MSEKSGTSGNQIQEDIGRSEPEADIQEDRDLSEKSGSQIGLLAALIVLVCQLVLMAHWPSLSSKALMFDDEQYLTENYLVQTPSLSSAWRFLSEVSKPSTVRGYYQPLTMISLMIDRALGGRSNNLRPFHRMSLAFHLMNTALLIVLLYLLFGQVWVAAAVGLLFGLHPLTAETIPWVGERKTLLAAFFSLWSLILYVRYARKGNWKLYGGCMLMYAAALMSKPTSTPLPVLMILMDYWPLRRLKKQAVIEKLPFFVVGGVSAIITYVSQSSTYGVTLPSEYGAKRIPLTICHNIIFYLIKIVWPANLSSNYAFPKAFGLSDPMVLTGVIGTCILIPLLLISLRRTRAVFTGWLFFFVGILPTMQIIGFNYLIASTKFVYLPSIGLLMILASLLVWFCRTYSFSEHTRLYIVVITIVLVLAGAEIVTTRRYLVHWRDTVSLQKHFLTVTPNAAHAHFNVGSALQSAGKHEEAISYYRQALKIRENHFYAHKNLGDALSEQDKLAEAMENYRRAIQIKPDYFQAYYKLGVAFESQGDLNEAIRHYRQAIAIKGDYFLAYYKLGVAYKSQDKLDDAITCYRRALKIRPGHSYTHKKLGDALLVQGKLPEGMEHYRQALESNPNYAEAHNNLGIALQSQGEVDEGISHFRKSLEIAPRNPEAHCNLGKALTMKGELNEGLEHFREAAQLKPNWPVPLNHMARILATHPDPEKRDISEAIVLGERAAKLTNYKNASILETLAGVYAAAGRFEQALTTTEAALELASAARAEKLMIRLRKQLQLYKQKKP